MNFYKLAIGLCACIAVATANARPAYETQPVQLSPTTESWMKELPDDLPLTAISIPGTYNSLALTGRVLTSPTQAVGVGEQLELGIRAIDLMIV
ncbi:MAG: hypothetical protein JWQ11_2385, partial [Rhizobacter sp.]|nr:hypothetical protein [Rhizobacter sp.]